MRRAVVVVAFSALAATACEEELEGFPRRDVERAGISLPDGGWASSPWPGQIDDIETEGLIEIAPTAGIALYHGLDRHPVEIQCYVGFAEDPGRVMPAAGNACEIHEIGLDEDGDAPDGRYVLVRNGSGGSFFYRFVLR